jgi:hypothetical protein
VLLSAAGRGPGGRGCHGTLDGRDLPNQHPIGAISGLEEELAAIREEISALRGDLAALEL